MFRKAVSGRSSGEFQKQRRKGSEGKDYLVAKQGVFRLKTLKNLLALLILMSVMGPGLTCAKQTDVRKEIERLRSSDPAERAAAAKILGNIGDRRAAGCTQG